LRFLRERPVLGAALIAVLQTGILDLVVGLLLYGRFLNWSGLIFFALVFFIGNAVMLTRERRRRRRRSEASQQSP